MIVSLAEFRKQKWQSLERTRAFYKEALLSEFDVAVENKERVANADAIVNFLGSKYWQMSKHPNCPVLFGIHGGLILNQDFMSRNIKNIETTDVFLVNCQSDAAILKRMFDSHRPKICCLPLPVDIRKFKPTSKGAARRDLQIKKGDFYIGFVSRLLPQKNLHQLLLLMSKLKDKHPTKKIIAVIVGNYWVDYPVLNYVTEEYPAVIASMVKHYGLQENIVYFPGNLSNEELVNCYNSMDVLFHPTNSIDENFGYTAVEAMACGVPVVGAAYGGLKDSVQNEITGFLISTWTTKSGIRFDILKSLQAVSDLMVNKEKCEEMAYNGIVYVHNNLTFTACAKILCGAVKASVADRKKSKPLKVDAMRNLTGVLHDSYLPEIEKPWDLYRTVVDEYVSHPSVVLNSSTLIYTPSYLLEESPRNYFLNDPAWPARFQLSDEEEKIVKRCRVPKRMGNFANGDRIQRNLVRQLIDKGVLSCSFK